MRAPRLSALAASALIASTLVVLAGTTPAGAIEVGTEQELRDAFANVNETEIVLTADITIACDDDNQIFRTDPVADLVIDGAGHTITFPCEAGDESLFVVDDSPASFNTLTLRDTVFVDTGTGYAVTFVDGHVVAEGIETDGWADALRADTVVVRDSHLHDGDGAGIRADADVTVERSTFAALEAGIEAGGQVPVTVTNSTFSGNTIGLSARSAATTLLHVTFAGNDVHVLAVGGSFTSTASAYGSSTVEACDFSTPPAIASGGHNVVAGDCGLVAATDSQGVAAAALGLGPLGGDSLPVHAPAPDSVLVDAIAVADCGPSNDELGTARPQGDGCEVGAVEVLPATVPTPDPTPAPAPVPPAATPVVAPPAFTG